MSTTTDTGKLARAESVLCHCSVVQFLQSLVHSDGACLRTTCPQMAPREKKQRVGRNAAESERSLPVAASSGIGKCVPKRPLSALQQKLARRLSGGDFRQLNERLYKTTGAQAAALMKANPSLFATYHAGYADQVQRWPTNPLDQVIAYLKTQPAELIVADLGCGEARLAREAPQTTVHSFDLVSSCSDVVACDIACTPLEDSSVDIAVFCLSLMGTNYGDFLAEARRILKPGGLVLVAEVASRFEEQGAKDFVSAVARLGFAADETHAFVNFNKDKCRGGGDGRSKTKIHVKGRHRGAIKDKRRRMGGMPLGKASAATDKPFFLHFAFQSTKKKKCGQSVPKNMPMLKACVYKKR